MFKKTISLFLILLVRSLWAGETGPLTLEAAIAEALASNPEVSAAEYRSGEALARIPQANGFDDPMVGVMFDDVPIDTANVGRSEEIDYRIEQKFPFPGKRRLKGKSARFNAAAIQAEQNGRIGDLLLDLKKTYYELYRIDRQLEVNRENQGLIRSLLVSAKTAYAAGHTTADAPLKAQVELSKLINEETLLHQERITHAAHLKAVLNRPSHEEIELPEKLDWPRLSQNLEEVVAIAFEDRPEIDATSAMEKRDQARLAGARLSLLPDLQAGFQYGQRPGLQDTWSGTAMINLPIFFWTKNRGEIREAKAGLMATRAEAESLKIHTQHEIEQAYSAIQASEQVVRAYENEILPQAKTTLSAARTAYRGGKIDFMTLIDAARTYREFQSSYYREQARYGMVYAELERLTGKELGGEK